MSKTQKYYQYQFYAITYNNELEEMVEKAVKKTGNGEIFTKGKKYLKSGKIKKCDNGENTHIYLSHVSAEGESSEDPSSALLFFDPHFLLKLAARHAEDIKLLTTIHNKIVEELKKGEVELIRDNIYIGWTSMIMEENN